MGLGRGLRGGGSLGSRRFHFWGTDSGRGRGFRTLKSEDLSLTQKCTMCKRFHLQAFVRWFCQYLGSGGSTGLYSNLIFSGRNHIGLLFTWAENKKFALDVTYTSPTRAVLFHDVTDLVKMAAPKAAFLRLSNVDLKKKERFFLIWTRLEVQRKSAVSVWFCLFRWAPWYPFTWGPLLSRSIPWEQALLQLYITSDSLLTRKKLTCKNRTRRFSKKQV